MPKWDIKEMTAYCESWRYYDEEHDNVKYLFEAAYSHIVDDFDYAIASEELSRNEPQGWGYIKKFEFLDGEHHDTLDLTWMRKRDSFELKSDDDYQNIKYIKVNLDNVIYSELPEKRENIRDIELTIDGSKTRMSPFRQIREFKAFLDDSSKVIDSIRLEGFHPLIKRILTSTCEKYRINVIEEEKSNDKVRKLKR